MNRLTFLALLFTPPILLACSASKTTNTKSIDLNGEWILWTISTEKDPGKIFNEAKMPMLIFDVTKMSVTGNNGCNRLSGKYTIPEKNKISFSPLITTKMACPGIGDGESIFMSAVEKTNGFSIRDDTLKLWNGEKELMSFTRKK